MRDFLLDTQTIRYWYDNECPQHAAVIGNIELLKEKAVSVKHKSKLLISVITLGEIEFGHRVQVGDRSAQNAARSRFVREQFPVSLELTDDSVTAYGEIRSRLFNKYAPREKRKPGMRPEQLVDPETALNLQIQENDLWLCAQAAAHVMVLVTNDRMASIRRVSEDLSPPLLMQNWTKVGEAKLDTV